MLHDYLGGNISQLTFRSVAPARHEAREPSSFRHWGSLACTEGLYAQSPKTQTPAAYNLESLNLYHLGKKTMTSILGVILYTKVSAPASVQVQKEGRYFTATRAVGTAMPRGRAQLIPHQNARKHIFIFSIGRQCLIIPQMIATNEGPDGYERKMEALQI